jgi:hypothetical protein
MTYRSDQFDKWSATYVNNRRVSRFGEGMVSETIVNVETNQRMRGIGELRRRKRSVAAQEAVADSGFSRG